VFPNTVCVYFDSCACVILMLLKYLDLFHDPSMFLDYILSGWYYSQFLMKVPML
jgi:hypothetical protein